MSKLAETAFGCVGNSILTASGMYLDLLDPKPWQICIRDIATGLSNICRFNGQGSRFYSVAEHSVHAAKIAKDCGLLNDTVLALLLHDATEAYLGDVTRPLKKLLPEYQRLEDRLADIVFEKYQANKMAVLDIRNIDNALLIAERNELFSHVNFSSRWPGEDTVDEVDIDFQFWPPSRAKHEFLRVFMDCF